MTEDDLNFWRSENAELKEQVTTLSQALQMSKWHTERLKEENHHQGELIDELKDIVWQLTRELNRLRHEKEAKA